MKNLKEALEILIASKKFNVVNLEIEILKNIELIKEWDIRNDIKIIYGRLIESKVNLDMLETLIKLEDK